MGKLTTRIFAAAMGIAASVCAHAAGLGKLSVLSHLGQPLNAEIEILSLQRGEENALAAGLASAEHFLATGIDIDPALLGIRLTIVRADAGPVLRLTTNSLLNQPFLRILVELRGNTGRLVREYTLLLDVPAKAEQAST